MPIKGLKGGVGTKALGYGLGAAQEETEPNFNQTVLLLHGDGSEGAGNTSALGDPNFKAFRDNSSANNQIVVNGDAYGNDFSPYYYADGYWSYYGGNTGGYYFADSADLEIGTSDFTIEFWMNLDTISGGDYLTGKVPSGGVGSDTAFQIYMSGSEGVLSYWLQDTVDTTTISTPSSTISAHTWHFISCVRQSGTMRLYVDGVQKATGTRSGSVKDVAGGVGIGMTGEYADYLAGYMSNYRFVIGTCLRNDGTTFSVPTTPLTSTGSETKILTAQSNRFVDNSSTGRTPVLSGTAAKVSTNTPFTQSKTANVGSAYFGATTDDAEIKVSNLPTGASNRCIEFWVYIPSGQTFRGDTEYLVQYGGTSTAGAFGVSLVNNGGLPRLRFVGYSSDYTTDDDLDLNSWNFISLTYDGTDIKHYVNGTLVHTDTRTLDTDSHTALWVNAELGGGDTYVADEFYIADLAVYDTVHRTGNFTPPTSTVADSSNTKILTFQYSGAVRNVGFLDDSKYNHRVIRNGDAAIGTFSPFSLEDTYWSNYLNGNHPIEIADSGNGLDLTGDFTIEFWAYEPKIATTNGTVNIYISINTLDGFQFSNNGTNNVLSISGSVFSSTTAPLNQWNHIAIVRSGSGSNNISYYLNGTREAQGTNTDSIATTSMMLGGQDRGSTTGYHGFSGYLSNFRILKGTALYSGASITVPTEPLTAITNTSLLTCQSNRFVDNSTNNMALTTASSSPAKIQPFSPFAPSRSYSKDAVGGSAYFDGTGDDLTIMKSAPSQMLTTNWSIEMWVYITETGNIALMDHRGSNGTWGNQATDGLNFQFYATSSTLYWQVGSGTYLSGSYYPTPHSWNHFAVSNDGTQTSVFLNGTSILNGTSGNLASLAAGSAIDRFTIGRNPSSYDTEGYIGPVKIHLTEHYDAGASTITVPTVPFTADANTFLLLNFNNAGIIDHTMKNNLETEGNTRVSGQQIKFGTGSIYFDGTNDSLKLPNNENLIMGTGNWTIEFFMYYDNSSFTGYRTIIDQRDSSDSETSIVIYFDAGNSLDFYSAGAMKADINTSSLSVRTWHHIALVKNGSTTKFYLDGTATGTSDTSDTRDYVAAGDTHIGERYNTSQHFLGYLDDFRITKGVARYTSNFTAPTKAFANK